jgi:protein-S-isoprenylcysteine O-methyltransferase Ste14
MLLAVYLISALVLLIASFVVFRIFVRRDYWRKGRLTPFSTFLEVLIFALHGTFTYIYIPSDWPVLHISPLLNVIGVISMGGGLAIVITAMVGLGLCRSLGQEANALKQPGLYRATRNPQIVGYALLVIGYAALWPSWFALGWVALYAAIAHTMVLTEEEHLRNTHGQEYVQYCKQVPRYLGFLMKIAYEETRDI